MNRQDAEDAKKEKRKKRDIRDQTADIRRWRKVRAALTIAKMVILPVLLWATWKNARE